MKEFICTIITVIFATIAYILNSHKEEIWSTVRFKDEE